MSNDDALEDHLDRVNSDLSTTFEEAYERLLPIAENSDRKYLNWVLVHPSGFALATDAHCMGVLPCQTGNLDHEILLPSVDTHKTDSVSVTREDGSVVVRVGCDHKNDKSGVYESSSPDEVDFPDYRGVIPHRDKYETDDCTSRICLNPDILSRLRDSIDEEGLYLHFLTEDSPVLAYGSFGFGLAMPRRWGSI